MLFIVPKKKPEINRIFRTNIFNLIKRRNLEDDRIKRYPVLRENNRKEQVEQVISKLQQRSHIPNFNMRHWL
jgi:hypothetical protein